MEVVRDCGQWWASDLAVLDLDCTVRELVALYDEMAV
jgi:hypothetical protein